MCLKQSQLLRGHQRNSTYFCQGEKIVTMTKMDFFNDKEVLKNQKHRQSPHTALMPRKKEQPRLIWACVMTAGGQTG